LPWLGLHQGLCTALMSDRRERFRSLRIRAGGSLLLLLLLLLPLLLLLLLEPPPLLNKPARGAPRAARARRPGQTAAGEQLERVRVAGVQHGQEFAKVHKAVAVSVDAPQRRRHRVRDAQLVVAVGAAEHGRQLLGRDAV
jgi:hypothetical protein